jgi:hypothetical protein
LADEFSRRANITGSALWQGESPATQTIPDFVSSVKFHLTSHWLAVFCVRIAEDQLQSTPDMKKLFTLTMLIWFALICSCQKQDSAAERQLAQRKVELDAREKALDEREKATANMKAEKERRMQQLPPDVQHLIPDPAKVKAQRDARMQEQLARRKRLLEEFQRKGIEAAKTDAMRHAEELKAAKKNAERAMTAAPAAVYLAAEATSPPSLAASPEAGGTSPSPSPTPQ